MSVRKGRVQPVIGLVTQKPYAVSVRGEDDPQLALRDAVQADSRHQREEWIAPWDLFEDVLASVNPGEGEGLTRPARVRELGDMLHEMIRCSVVGWWRWSPSRKGVYLEQRGAPERGAWWGTVILLPWRSRGQLVMPDQVFGTVPPPDGSWGFTRGVPED